MPATRVAVRPGGHDPASRWPAVARTALVRALVAVGLVAAGPFAGAPAAQAQFAGLDTPFEPARRVLDLTKGTPPELQSQRLPAGARLVVANPYAPHDRRFFQETQALACHPAGGLVLYARSARLGADGAAADNGVGLWRVETDGRVRPLAVRPDGARGRRRCGLPVAEAQLPDLRKVTGLAVQPDGGVLVADSANFLVLRFAGDRVEQFAGGGAGACSRGPYDGVERGHRDGPAAQALFSGELALASLADGTVLVAEDDHASTGAPGNCTLRRIDAERRVSTWVGTGNCADRPSEPAAFGTRVATARVAAGAGGDVLLLGSDRGKRDGTGPDVVFTKVHRVAADGTTTLIGRAGHGARFDPAGRLVEIGHAPDGRPLAFNRGYSQPGFVTFDANGKWVRWWTGVREANTGAFPYNPPLDGPREAARLLEVRGFCAATDGFLYVLDRDAVRRIDPKSGELTTWVQ